ncbi:MAG: hypothetical protein ACRDVG_08680, partial [Jatrophihabitantaceae bacterium]
MRSLRLLCAALAVAVVPVIAAVPTQATARATAPARQTVVPGVQVWVQHWTTPNGSPERSSLMTVDLTNPHLRVVARSAYRVVGGAYQPVSTMIRQDSAIGGINGDFFDLGTRTGVPDGGIVRNGTILKTPQPGRNAN